MVAPTPSKLDQRQILQNVHDEATGTLRTTAQAVIANADIEVQLDAADGDNVAISDGTDTLAINADGSINVNVSGTGRVISSKYTEVLGIVTGITTLIGTYTAVANNYLQKVEFSGTNIAEYELVINGVTQDKKRTYFGSSLNDTFDFVDGLKITTGQVVNIYVVHNRPFTGDFNTRIQTMVG